MQILLLTLFKASISAPPNIKILTISEWPLDDAANNADRPSWYAYGCQLIFTNRISLEGPVTHKWNDVILSQIITHQ